MSLTSIYMRMSYGLIGGRLDNYLDSFDPWRRTMRQADMNITLRMYLATAIMTSLFAFLAGIFLLVGLNSLGLPLPVVLGPFVGLIFAILTFTTFWYYPSYLASIRRQKLEATLPTVASYMAAMASAGVTPDKIFLSMSKKDLGLEEMIIEARKISRDIVIFGFDIIHAMLEASARAPSPDYASFLEGIVAVFTSGGDLQRFLELATKDLMIQKIQREKDYIEALGLIAELFLVVGVVAPIFGIVIIAMMTFMVSGGGMNSYVLLATLIYVVIPIGESMILLMLDGMQPED